MYCINCGVKLADTEKTCPLCGVAVFHPHISQPEADPLFPPQKPVPQVNFRVAHIVITALFLLPILICLQCDLQINGSITWCGYVIGALLLTYVIGVLPFWFRRPNPVIFVPCGFAAAALYLLYIDLATGGNWFLPFALPLTGGIGLVVTAVVTLLRYVRRGQLYILGGAAMALGIFMPVVELLSMITFRLSHFAGWSLYPFTALFLLGGMLIFLAICPAARETMERKFFV